jgi:hypothetical protein
VVGSGVDEGEHGHARRCASRKMMGSYNSRLRFGEASLEGERLKGKLIHPEALYPFKHEHGLGVSLTGFFEQTGY